ncbi:Uncharacterised protein [Corynebacterium renale]|uniref:hypothetical protein n=1 Tax=Corynebacterium renale TaxID=1724 RepID=UPI000DA4169B|nr:hypothetical protein [Corynebacterium renale]SQG63439.1 Uncharacterised protein [Corynebacterium renale]STD00113.1 Uncharacterised protein [Corynebacterium renale]
MDFLDHFTELADFFGDLEHDASDSLALTTSDGLTLFSDLDGDGIADHAVHIDADGNTTEFRTPTTWITPELGR